MKAPALGVKDERLVKKLGYLSLEHVRQAQAPRARDPDGAKRLARGAPMVQQRSVRGVGDLAGHLHGPEPGEEGRAGPREHVELWDARDHPRLELRAKRHCSAASNNLSGTIQHDRPRLRR